MAGSYRDPIESMEVLVARLEAQMRHHEQTLDYAQRELERLKSARRRQEGVEARRAEAERNKRPRGRPRADGLLPGSAEAWAADEKKRLAVIAERRRLREERKAERARQRA